MSGRKILKLKTIQPGEEIPRVCVGFDFGNGHIKIVFQFEDGTIGSVSVPTALAMINAARVQNLGVDTKDAYSIKIDGEDARWVVGDHALIQPKNWNGRNDTTRYAHAHALRALLALTAPYIPYTEYELVVSSGLPAETFANNAQMREDIRVRLSGKHGIYVNDEKTVRTVHVTYAATLMEGAGAIAAYIALTKKKPGTNPVAVIDSGRRTIDSFVMQKGIPISAFCKGAPIGVEAAVEMLHESFEQRYDFLPDPIETQEILYAYSSEVCEDKIKSPYPNIVNAGIKIPSKEIKGIIAEAVEAVGADTWSFISGAWRESDRTKSVGLRFDPLLMVGGGTRYFFKHLQKHMPHLVRMDNAVSANAHGYMLTALRFAKARSPKTKKVVVQNVQA